MNLTSPIISLFLPLSRLRYPFIIFSFDLTTIQQLEKYADGRICADHEPVSDDLDSSSCSEDLSDAEKSDLVSIEGSTFPFSQICIEELQNYSVPLSRYLMKLGF